MPRATTRSSALKKPAARSKPRRHSGVLRVRDFEDHVFAAAAQIAPADVSALLGQAQLLEGRLTAERGAHPVLGQRGRIALHLLNDHNRGACPQIPYYTVSLLTAALYYYLDPMDVVPDFIPGAGTADDALVFEVAWTAASAGIERYLAAKGLPSLDGDGRLPAKSKAKPKPKAKGKAKGKTAPKASRAAAARRSR